MDTYSSGEDLVIKVNLLGSLIFYFFFINYLFIYLFFLLDGVVM